jgi:2-polyprenyl-3-methyl-5-hydroxy-6-metoxy-1,4-benzoquinol methylase
LNDNESLETNRALWDQAAATFDDEPDHGLRDPQIRAAWQELLAQWLPPAPKSILDIGCGTGSLSLLMAEMGYAVTGIDFAPAMIAQAKAKLLAVGHSATFHIMDAAHPELAPQRFDALVCRHLLWALPKPARVLERWLALLAPGGRMVLIEGFWQTGAGLHAQQVVEVMPRPLAKITVEALSSRSILWGGEVNDERYAVIADF